MRSCHYSKVLILNLGGLGDFITTMPVAAALKAAGAGTITSLVWPALEEFARIVPALDRVAALPKEKENDPQLSEFAEELAGAAGFDLVLDFAFQPRAGIITRAVRGRRTVGFALEPAEYPYYTDILPNLPGQLRLERNLGLLAHLHLPRPASPDFSVRIPESTRLRVEDLLRDRGLDPALERPLAVHPGSGVSKRNWPAERFARLADLIAEHTLRTVVLLGGRRRTYDGRDEVSLAGEVERMIHAPVVNLAGELDLAELACLLGGCSLYLGNNSGPAHLAATVAGTPSLLVWAPRNEKRWRPWGRAVELVWAEIECGESCPMNECDKIEYCLRQISVEQMYDRFLKVFYRREAAVTLPGGRR